MARTYNIQDIETLLSKYTTLLLNQDRKADAMELLRKANHHDKAAALLYKIAKEAVGLSPLAMKKLYVLAGLEVERHKEYSRSNHKIVTVCDPAV